MGDSRRVCDVVAFDLDGTLVDTTALHVTATQAAVQEIFGDPAPPELVTQSLGRPLPESMRVVSAGRGKEMELVQAFLRHYSMHESDGAQCFPNVVPALAALRAAGIRLALLSNKLRRWGLAEIERLGIAACFDPVVFMEDMPIPKPSGLALRPILQRLQVAPRRVLVVGDGAGDIACARAAGAMSGAALWGNARSRSSAGRAPRLSLRAIPGRAHAGWPHPGTGPSGGTRPSGSAPPSVRPLPILTNGEGRFFGTDQLPSRFPSPPVKMG